MRSAMPLTREPRQGTSGWERSMRTLTSRPLPLARFVRGGGPVDVAARLRRRAPRRRYNPPAGGPTRRLSVAVIDSAMFNGAKLTGMAGRRSPPRAQTLLMRCISADARRTRYGGLRGRYVADPPGRTLYPSFVGRSDGPLAPPPGRLGEERSGGFGSRFDGGCYRANRSLLDNSRWRHDYGATEIK